VLTRPRMFCRDLLVSNPLVSLALAFPLLIFTAAAFALPLIVMGQAVILNPEVSRAFPQTASKLDAWKPGPAMPLPQEEAFVALAADLRSARSDDDPGLIGTASRVLNSDVSGFRSLLSKTLRAMAKEPTKGASYRDFLGEIDGRWLEPRFWEALKQRTNPLTAENILRAVDLERAPTGGILLASPDQRVYLSVYLTTLMTATVTTAFALLIGYPFAAALVGARSWLAGLLWTSVALPFWTSLLAKTSAWIVLLQTGGIVNKTLQSLGLVTAPLELIFNSTGVIVVMTYLMLPMTIMPIYAVMKTIPAHYVRAALSLGGSPLRVFWQVYFPLTLPGVAAAGTLTFIVSAGYYITPTLVGGGRDQMIGYFIAYFANVQINWGLASALGCVLLLVVLVLYLVSARYLGIRQLAGLK
jgi:putative spermidine/putrescine transport system permease protein